MNMAKTFVPQAEYDKVLDRNLKLEYALAELLRFIDGNPRAEAHLHNNICRNREGVCICGADEALEDARKALEKPQEEQG